MKKSIVYILACVCLGSACVMAQPVGNLQRAQGVLSEIALFAVLHFDPARYEFMGASQTADNALDTGDGPPKLFLAVNFVPLAGGCRKMPSGFVFKRLANRNTDRWVFTP